VTDEALDRLAAMYGVEPSYSALTGQVVEVSDDAKRAVLRAMDVAAGDDDEIAASLSAAEPLVLASMEPPESVSCFVPDWLRDNRVWGIGCQLYGLRSERNWGIGDFADLARFAEIAAELGADFVGVNPLHALFFSNPEHCSPFSPSHRDFLNPLYIAVDHAPGYAGMEDALQPPDEVRASELVDYQHIGPLKAKALGVLFRIFQEKAADAEREDFQRFVAARGQPLYLHALFEALSEAMVRNGHGAGWHGWPEEFRHPGNDSVRAFAEEQQELVSFHAWLQWLADRQLGEACTRAREAGMRVGLYLDLAVGVVPDGSATWADRELVVPGAHIGAPPDYFNAHGQDWGLAPLSPADLAACDFQPYRESIDAVLSRAGALRIDHAMSLYRLFWIPESFTPADGAYVRYPFHDMLRSLADISRKRRAIVIGEDLGVVPPGFREVMQATEIQSYRVFFFETRDDWFLRPADYPREALACVTTHDLPPLAGWWGGHDIETRQAIGMMTDPDAASALEYRAHMRRRMLGLFADAGLLPEEMGSVLRAETGAPEDLPDSVAIALHRLMARTPSRLLVVQAEDLVGSAAQVNIPGTTDEHPNWRRKLPVDLENLSAHPLLAAITAALREERPKAG
jgi:4-alpha-glucanotransferase